MFLKKRENFAVSLRSKKKQKKMDRIRLQRITQCKLPKGFGDNLSTKYVFEKDNIRDFDAGALPYFLKEFHKTCHDMKDFLSKGNIRLIQNELQGLVLESDSVGHADAPNQSSLEKLNNFIYDMYHFLERILDQCDVKENQITLTEPRLMKTAEVLADLARSE